MTLKEIRKALENDGEVKIGNIELIWDGFSVEVSKNDKHEEVFSFWWETEEYLRENGIIN